MKKPWLPGQNPGTRAADVERQQHSEGGSSTVVIYRTSGATTGTSVAAHEAAYAHGDIAHSNRAALDDITAELVTAITHDNRDALDDLTSQLVTDITHTNRAVLDGIDSGDVSNWDEAHGWGDHLLDTDNIHIGTDALKSRTTGNQSVAIGIKALEDLSSGGNSVAVGHYALKDLATSGSGTAVGHTALELATGSNNTGVGQSAGAKVTTGTGNTFVGYETGNNASQKVDATNSMALGQNAYTTASNQIVIGDTNVTQTVLRGNALIPTAYIGGASHYSEFEADGTLVFRGDATVWDDLLVPVTSTTLGGSKDPHFAKFKDNGSGSQGVFTYLFDPSTEEELYFVAQIPHSWAGTAITPHVHWAPTVASDENPSGQTVNWGLEYTWCNIGGTFGNSTIVYAKSTTGLTTAYHHYMTNFSAITPGAGTQDGISSILACRIFRDATSATDDTYEHDAALLGVDFHFEKNTVGSRGISTK